MFVALSTFGAVNGILLTSSRWVSTEMKSAVLQLLILV